VVLSTLPLPVSVDGRLSKPAAAAIRVAIKLAGGREVCFACQVDDGGVVRSARVVARGDVRSVLALPGFAEKGEMLVHNHPSGLLEPSQADLEVAARVYGNGVGFAIVDNDASELYVVVEVPAPRAPRRWRRRDGRRARPRRPDRRRMRRYEDRPAQRALAARSRRSTTRAASGCSRRAPAWASRWATSSPRSAGPPRTASAPW
jgi:ATP-dependent DNA helicase DinG